MLRAVPDKLFGVMTMFGAIALLFAVPWLDTSKVRSMRYRPAARTFFLIFIAVTLMLGWCGSKEPDDVVIATGVAEILGGIGLLHPRTRKAAAVGLALYAVGVYPANLYHAFARVHVPPLPDSWWYHGPRLALQPVFVLWALYAGGLIGRSRR